MKRKITRRIIKNVKTKFLSLRGTDYEKRRKRKIHEKKEMNTKESNVAIQITEENK